jgi:hypothetical protein
LINNALLDDANMIPWKQYTRMNGVFCGFTPTLYNEDFRQLESEACVEVGLNTSTIALQVVRGDKKGTQCLGV